MARTSTAHSGQSPSPITRGVPSQEAGEHRLNRRAPRRSERWPRLESERGESNPRDLKALLTRLRRRKLGEWLLAYLALAWMALQMTDALREIWAWPESLPRAITLALALGVLPTGVIAWYHGEKGRQKVCLLELVAISVLLMGSGWLIWLLCA